MRITKISKPSRKMLVCTFLQLLFVVCNISFLPTRPVRAFNFSPQANFVISPPIPLRIFKPQSRSSYFGFSLVIRPNSIIVGAPRAQSTLEAQRNINETGAVYRCSLTNTTCYPYIFESRGNINKEDPGDYIYDDEKRDNQWLGASMDGGLKDTDKLIVCAPRFITPARSGEAYDYLLHGICYWINDTLSTKPTNVKSILPLQLITDQVKNEKGHSYYYYMLAEQGLSAHVTPDNEEFLIGAPGIHTWKGSVVHFRRKTFVDEPGLSRRSVDATSNRVNRQAKNPAPYKPFVPNPETWQQGDDSYFGYSVSSGYFDIDDPKKLLYVATAPKADNQTGAAYLFDFTKDSIDIRYTFRGKQFGEYFGYSLLVEDINNDGLSDVIVAAPQYSIAGMQDDGAIYVFLNKGQFVFERKIYVSPVQGRIRFGTTLSPLGDINHDGFKDIAVGGPYAYKNGAVFIYLGSEKGLRDKPSQIIKSSMKEKAEYGIHLFGHGLSKGSDIDNNGFNDFAVGAPNTERVFVYRSYPVIKVHTTISSQNREIKPEQQKFKVTFCYGFSTTSSAVQNQPMALHIALDPQVKRVKISNSQSNELNVTVTAGRQQQCQVLDCDVRYSVADIFKPIELEIHHEIINGIPDSEVFCDHCVAIDPDEPKVTTERIIFSTGCATDICVADLEVKSVNLQSSYTLGSSRTMSVTYEVTNNGETAYLPQINITSSNRLPFARIPSYCKTDNEFALVCDLNRGQAMSRGSKDSITIIYEMSGVSGNTLTLLANVFSTGKERNPANNRATDIIALKEFTQVDVVGFSKTGDINLEKVKDKNADIINIYEVKSNGPSIAAVEVAFYIPIAYKVPGSSNVIPIIDLNNITMQAVYDSQRIAINFYQNQTQLILNSFEVASTSSQVNTKTFSSHSSNGINYDATQLGYINEMSSSTDHYNLDSVSVASMSHRRRRRDAAVTQTPTKDQYARLMHTPADQILDDHMMDRVPYNRTIAFYCNDPTVVDCVRAVMNVYTFKPEKPIAITMKYNIDLKEVNEILIDPWEVFVVHIGVDVKKIGGFLDASSLSIKKKIDHNIISKHQLHSTPIWIYIVAALSGLLLLALVTYGLYKAGFFKRATKDEMAQLVKQNNGEIEPEAENLNTEEH